MPNSKTADGTPPDLSHSQYTADPTVALLQYLGYQEDVGSFERRLQRLRELLRLSEMRSLFHKHPLAPGRFLPAQVASVVPKALVRLASGQRLKKKDRPSLEQHVFLPPEVDVQEIMGEALGPPGRNQARIALLQTYAVISIGATEDRRWAAVLADVLAHSEETGGAECLCPLAEQVLRVELPLVLALLSEKEGHTDEAIETLAGLMDDAADGRQLLPDYLPILGELLASWARSILCGGRLGADKKTLGKLVSRLDRILRDADRLAADAAPPWSGFSAEQWSELVSACRQELKPWRRKGSGAGKGNGSSEKTVHRPTLGLSVMRDRKRVSTARFSLAFPETRCLLEAAPHGTPLIDGHWRCELTCNGRNVEPAGQWEEICWFSEDGVEYQELELACTAGVRVQRQFLVDFTDGVLFLADAVLGERSGQWQYRCEFPLPPGRRVHAATAEQTRDILVRHKKQRQMLVIPPALDEWRAADDGRFAVGDQKISLAFTRQGRAFYAPLFFAWDQDQLKQPITWRQLTVAERMQKVSGETAVGYRVQWGDRQWLIYRSLAPAANRTVLGHNLVSEMLFARFDTDGTVDQRLEVESPR